jgi:hypothetical protein
MVPEQIRSGHNGLVRIEDAGNHSIETLSKLQRILAREPLLTPDPKRQHFYEVAAEPCIYYIHVSPVSGRISLLAVWGSRPGINCAGRAA